MDDKESKVVQLTPNSGEHAKPGDALKASYSILEAFKLMKEREIGALIVTDTTDKAVGIVSDRDCTQKVILEELPAKRCYV